MIRFAALVFAAGLGLAGAPAQAAPGHAVVAGGDSGVQLVAEGCGPGGVRDARGFCRPAYRRLPPPYRRCPYGFHATPYGCRRF